MMERPLFLLFLISLLWCIAAHSVNGEDWECDLDHFRCQDDRCILHTWVCDGTNDCAQGEDEIGCKDECGPRFFECANGDCVNIKFKCNGINDCGDLSDEVGCGNGPLHPSCKDKFLCNSPLLCIPLEDHCNGVKDCADGSDEQNCTVSCSSDQFRCFDGSYCISKMHVCDGQIDCEDESDEVDCNQEIYLCRHHPDGYLCDDHSDCIMAHSVCDGHDDCDDGSDEKNNCSVTCQALDCDNACSLTPYGVKCICDEGYTLSTKDNRTCVDIDECSFSDDQRSCSQHCFNTPNSYYCSCSSGYELASDRKYCKAKGYEPVLIYATASEIRSFSLRKHFYDVLLEGLGGVRGLAVDTNGRKIFWSEVGDDHHPAVYSIDHDNPMASKSTIVSFGLSTPHGLAFDYIEKNLYIADSGKPAIVACRTESSVCVTVFNKTVVTQPVDIALDPKRGYMYWTELSAAPAIMRGAMDGKSHSKFVSSNLGLPVSVVVDLTTNRLFWIDSYYSLVEFVTLDGKDRKTVVGYKIAHPSMLSVFEDEVIWANKAKHNIIAANKFTGRNVRPIIKEVPEPTALVVYHSSLQYSENALNKCWTKLCSHICLLGPKSGSTCACPSGYVLDSSGRNCEVMTTAPFLLAAYMKEIITVPLAKFATLNISTLHLFSMRNVYALAYLAKSDEILFSDSMPDGKISLNLLSDIYTHPKSERIVEDVGSVQSLAIDESANVIYWVDGRKNTIEIASFDGVERRTLPVEIETPLALALDISQGLLYYSSISSRAIISCHQDGTACFDFLYESIFFPNCIVISRNRLYWSDLFSRDILSVNLNGKDRKRHAVTRDHPISFAVHGTTLFWTEVNATAILSVDMTEPNRVLRIETGRPQLTGLIVADPNRISVTQCSERNGGCDHMCIPAPGNVTCACSRDFQLQEDGKTCKMEHVEGCLGHLCPDNITCVPHFAICDRHFDCPDASDEADCLDQLTCIEDEFLCADGECVFIEFVCDKDEDCRDGSDETNCTVAEGEACCCGKLSCDNGKTCIYSTEICDYFEDCEDGSDERSCSPPVCSDDNFTCRHKCIPMGRHCDGFEDCSEGEDEENCSQCGDDYFTCYSGDCIILSAVCDGSPDCSFHEDEAEHLCTAKCSVNEFKCNNKECIQKDTVCDGFIDCSDASDELPSQCQEIEKEKANEFCEGFKCLTGQCIENDKFCDGYTDCRDGSDEGSCETTCKTSNPCNHICHDTPNGPTCSCDKGFQVFSFSPFVCEDTNECEIRNGDCSQKCMNDKGGHNCTCWEGYERGANARSCKAIGARPFLLLGTEHGIKQVSAERRIDSLIIATKSMPVALDLNIHSQEFFWTEYVKPDNHSAGMALYKSTGRNVQMIVQLEEEIGGLAIDWITGNIYYSKFSKSTKSGSIIVRNTNYFATVIPGLLEKAESLILHGRLRLLCFLMTRESSESGIACHTLHGQAWLSPPRMHLRPVALSFDQANDNLYCYDAQIGLVAYQFHQVYARWFVLKKHMLQIPRQVYSMDVFEGIVYMTDQESNTVRKISTYEPELDEDEVEVIGRPGPIKVLHSLRQSAGPNPCANKACMFICLPAGTDGGICRCKDGYQNSSNPHCEDPKVVPSYVPNVTVQKPSKLPAKAMSSTKQPTSASINYEVLHHPGNFFPASTAKSDVACSLLCQNGGSCVVIDGQDICRCPFGFKDKLCQLKTNETNNEASKETSLAWVAGLAVGIIVIIIVAIATFCFFKRRRAHPSLIRAIKFQNPNLRHESKEDKQELITEISFGNPGFQDVVEEDETDSSGDQDWWKKLLARSRTSVDSAFVSKQSSLRSCLDEEGLEGESSRFGTDRHKLILK